MLHDTALFPKGQDKLPNPWGLGRGCLTMEPCLALMSQSSQMLELQACATWISLTTFCCYPSESSYWKEGYYLIYPLKNNVRIRKQKHFYKIWWIMKEKKKKVSHAWCYRPTIPVTWKAEGKELLVQVLPGRPRQFKAIPSNLGNAVSKQNLEKERKNFSIGQEVLSREIAKSNKFFLCRWKLWNKNNPVF